MEKGLGENFLVYDWKDPTVMPVSSGFDLNHDDETN